MFNINVLVRAPPVPAMADLKELWEGLGVGSIPKPYEFFLWQF